MKRLQLQQIDGGDLNMQTDEIIARVKSISMNFGVEHLFLFGSYADGRQTDSSDLDFFVKGVPSGFGEYVDAIDHIPTLKKIDIIDYDRCENRNLIEDMDKYGKQIY